MKRITPILLALSLGGCFGGDDKDEYVACINSSDYQEFECINRNDFKSADGTQTDLSRTIADCTVLASTEAACDMNTLSFITTLTSPENPTPTRAQILSRLVVSHQWMADNFALLLEDMPDDMLNLFGSVTAIVIHDELRPAFFWPETGAIYIDPYYLWTTAEQYNTISQDPDYRADFGNELKFVSLARYTLDGDYAFASGNSRTPEQTLYALSAVLFHELAHARDFFPVSEIVAADSNLSPGGLFALLVDQVPSPQVSVNLQDTYPLENTTLFGLAEVMYRGQTASPALKLITASEVGDLLASEGANDDYGYTYANIDENTAILAEATAMLFEETMMKIHYNLDREIAYATPLNEQQANCDDFSFDWTAVNRYADSLVAPRVSLVVDGLLPGHSHSTYPAADGSFTWCQPLPAARGTRIAQQHITRDYWH